MASLRAGVLTVSDGCARGEREDGSGRVLRETLEASGYSIAATAIVPDEPAAIQDTIIAWCDGVCDVILTTGGTGFSPRDITPEATKRVIEREAPGLAELLRWTGYTKLDRAVLSRGVAGIRNRTLIVNLPGSTGGVRDGLEVLLPLIPHAIALLRDEPVDHTPAIGTNTNIVANSTSTIQEAAAATERRPPSESPPVNLGSHSPSANPSTISPPELGGRRATPSTPPPTDSPPTAVTLLETNLDDFQPEFYDVAMEALFSAGALDVFLMPIQMKKGRPATLLSVLARPEQAETLAGVIFTQTTAFGIRYQNLQRYTLDRAWQPVETPYGPVRIKIGSWRGRETGASPEYEDVRSAAQKHGVPPKAVHNAALAAYHRNNQDLKSPEDQRDSSSS